MSEDQERKRAPRSDKGKKRKPYESYLYSFRLTTEGDEQSYAETFEQWVIETMQAQGITRGEAVADTVKGLINNYQGADTPKKSGSSNRAMHERFNRLEEQIGVMRELLTMVANNPTQLQALNSMSERVENGEDVGEDIIGNILADFGRG